MHLAVRLHYHRGNRFVGNQWGSHLASGSVACGDGGDLFAAPCCYRRGHRYRRWAPQHSQGAEARDVDFIACRNVLGRAFNGTQGYGITS